MCNRRAAAEIPAPQQLEIAQRRRTGMTPTRAPRIAQQIEVMADQPDHAVRHEPFEQIGADLVVRLLVIVNRFSHVVKQGRGPELGVHRRAPRQVEYLQRVKESVAFRMIAWRLLHAIEREQQIEELVVVHLSWRGVHPPVHEMAAESVREMAAESVHEAAAESVGRASVPASDRAGTKVTVLVTLVEAYEAKHFPIDLPDPVQ